MGALAIATTILQVLPSLLQAGLDVTALLENTNAVLKKAQDEGRDPTDAEWQALDSQVSALRSQLQS